MLELRPLGLADLDPVHALWADVEVRRYLWDGEVISRERAAAPLAASERDFAECGFGLWGITLRRGAELIGFAGLRRADLMLEPELLYGLHPAWWGRGFATEAARAVLAHGFELGLPVIGAATDAPNARSVRVLERLGMRQVERTMVHGLDTRFYRMSRQEWTRLDGRDAGTDG